VCNGGGWGVARFYALIGTAAATLGACALDPEPRLPDVTARHPLPPALASLPSSPPPAAPALPTSATAASLLGLSGPELSALIGPPRWRRSESPAEVWQYQGQTCVLDVYLYQEAGAVRVVHAEARDESALPVTLASCLQRLEAERRVTAPAS
jgi:hypothetical protein